MITTNVEMVTINDSLFSALDDSGFRIVNPIFEKLNLSINRKNILTYIEQNQVQFEKQLRCRPIIN